MKLTNGTLELDVTSAGGCVDRLRWNGVDILRPAPSSDVSPVERAAFPLVPFSGRIADGAFSFGGRTIALPGNFPPEPHAIHGYGWTDDWDPSATGGTAATLTQIYTGEAWPWPYRAEQVFTLNADGLSLRMAVTNNGDTAMPAGLGWHPYFPSEGACLLADVTRIWRSGARMIPDPPSALTPDCDLRELCQVNALSLDNCFDAGPSGTTIIWPETGIRLQMTASDAFSHLIVFTPPGAPYFCVEPVSHAPNAVNSDLPSAETGQNVLEPGETLEGEITLTIDRD